MQPFRTRRILTSDRALKGAAVTSLLRLMSQSEQIDGGIQKLEADADTYGQKIKQAIDTCHGIQCQIGEHK